MEPAPPASPLRWLALAGAFCLGALAWLVPLAAYALAYFLAVNEPDIGNRELLAAAGVAAVLVLAGPLGFMAWRRWHRAAIAYAAGMVIGVGPLLALLAWVFVLMRGSR